MLVKSLIPAFAAFSVAAAQSASLCSQATATINSQADAAQYTTCSTIKGDVLFGPQAAGTISLDGPDTINGNVISADAGNLVSLGSNTITRITGSFTLTNLTLLTSLTMPLLVETGEIAWTALPALTGLSFTTGVKKANKVLITNTFLRTLTGINLNTVQVLNINNNNRLTEFTTQIGNISQSLIIDANGNHLDVSFPNLIWAANMTFRNASSVSIPSLAKVNGSLGFYGNLFDSLQAPNLTSVGASLAIVNNPNLKNVSFPVLTSVGGANQIANNSAVTSISYPVLETVGGAIDFSGNFTTPSLPKLVDVKGGFNIQSTTQIDCSGFDKLSGNVIQGKYTCKTTADAKSSLGGGSTSSGSGSTSGGSGTSSSKNAAATPFIPNPAMAGLGIAGIVGGMLL